MTTDDLTSGADVPYWSALRSGRVVLPRCAGCGKWHWPAVWRCAECGGWEHEWIEVQPEGEIYSWTRTWHRFEGTEAFETPFVSVVVELSHESGIRLIGTLRGDSSNLEIGASVSGETGSISAVGKSIPALFWSIRAEEQV